MQPNTGIKPSQRFSRNLPCPICGGWDAAYLRGKGVRCYGYYSDDRMYAFCTRRELAGALHEAGSSNSYCHSILNECGCGERHSGEPPLNVNYQFKFPQYSGTRPSSVGASEYGFYETEYIYRDEDGSPLYRVIRYKNPKTFKQQHWESGKWHWGLGGTKRVLYRLPELVTTPIDEWVHLCEGEKDVENLRSLGNNATTNAGGCNGWRESFSRYLRGRKIVIVEDNDTAGFKRAMELVEILSPVAALLAVMWWSEAPTGYDMSDYLSHMKAGHKDECDPSYYITSCTRLEYERKYRWKN